MKAKYLPWLIFISLLTLNTPCLGERKSAHPFFLKTFLQKKQCQKCHQSPDYKDLKKLENKGKKLCLKCHPAAKHSNKHLPYEKGDCLSCHTVHESACKHLLKAHPQELCSKCHLELWNKLKKAKYKHQVVEKDCSSCHSPHSTNHPNHLYQDYNKLCLKCHPQIASIFSKYKYKHLLSKKDKACLMCHHPHFSDIAKRLKEKTSQLCIECHHGDKKLAKYQHGKEREQNCFSCHQQHGAFYPRLLSKTFPLFNYNNFSIEKYALCFSCHPKEAFTSQDTTSHTKFRNKSLNLHFVHVNKKRGRACKVCHDVHGTNNPHLIRPDFPLGQEKIPINYQKTTNGGSCSPGCHETKDYQY